MRALISSLLIVTACGCQRGEDQPLARFERGVTYVRSDDAEMVAAMRKARATMPQFERALGAPRAGQSGFGLKVSFAHGTGTVQVWLSDPLVGTADVSGVADDEPVELPTLKLGQRVTVARAAVADWKFVENGATHGGYTTRVLVARLPEGERRAAEQALAPTP